MEYSSRLFNRVSDYRQSLIDNQARLRELTADYTRPMEAYYKALKAVGSEFVTASRTFATDSANNARTVIEKAWKSGEETAASLRQELERTGDDIKAYAKNTGKDVQSRIDTRVKSIRNVPSKLENGIEVVKEAAGKLRSNFTEDTAVAEASPKKKASRAVVAKKSAPAPVLADADESDADTTV